jgi:anhydro-N-acetylmuramic acid kinase
MSAESVASVARTIAAAPTRDAADSRVSAYVQAAVEAIAALDARSAPPPEQLLVLGVHSEAAPDDDLSAEVAARLAEQTGITTVAAMSTRDRAAGGSGRPIAAICDWTVAHDSRLSRFVLHLDEATGLSHVPARCGPAVVRWMETGPGVQLLDALAHALTHGRQPSDPRGMLAVQGRQIKPLIRRWATHPFLQQDATRRLQPRDFDDAFVRETLEMTVERGWSVVDVLCTATHFIAACPADAVRQYLAKDHAANEVMLVGSGAQNGFLLRLVEKQFRGLGIATRPLTAIAPESYGGVAAALLACLTLDGVPANLPAVTGATGPRLLGHLTPGTSRNWLQCLEWMHRTARCVMARVA